MSVIDKVVNEWAFRCKKGYPDMNNPDDMKILKEIYSEYGIVITEETTSQNSGDYTEVPGQDNVFVKKSDIDPQTGKPLSTAELYKIAPSGKGRSKSATKYVKVVSNKPDKDKLPADVIDVLTKAGVKEDVINRVTKNPLFRHAANVEDFVKNQKKYMDAFYQDLHKYKIERGGYGELIPFVSIKDAHIGGPNEKDITDSSGKVLEVKDFSSGNELSLASGGSILKSTFLENYETFRKAITPFKSAPELRFVLPGIESYTSISQNYLAELQALVENFPLNSESIDKAYEEIKIKGKKYLIKKGQKYSLEFDENGDLIPSNNSPKLATDQESALRKLMQHPWVLGNSSPMRDLSIIKNSTLGTVNYLMLFLKGGGAVILDMSKDEDKAKVTIGRVANGVLTLNYKSN
jgi:hypothetical protein